MKVIHLELKEANAFVQRLHRHHKPVQGHRFSIGCEREGKLVGVAIVGRPVARMVDAHQTVEVTRLCTDGTQNACSFLYSACARAAKALGYITIQTYVLEDEPAVTLKAAGWQFDTLTAGGQWIRTNGEPRRTDQPTCRKQRWLKIL